MRWMPVGGSSLRWLALAAASETLAVVFGLIALTVYATDRREGLKDLGLADIRVGRDDVRELERKLGPSICRVQFPPDPLVIHLYEIQTDATSTYLQFKVNRYVERIQWSKDRSFIEACYTPLRRAESLRTEQGVKLGMALRELAGLYGAPTTKIEEGPLIRFRYEDPRYEWDLLFRDGQLMEWSIARNE